MDGKEKRQALELKGVEISRSYFWKDFSNARIQITNGLLYSKFFSNSCSGGPLDHKLGANKKNICDSCERNQNKCPGHFGFMKLFLPVLNIGYMKATQLILSVICKNCSRILINPGERRSYFLKYVRKIKKKGENYRIDYLSDILQECRRNKYCYYCFSKNGLIRKFGTLNFIHYLKTEKENKHRLHVSSDHSSIFLNDKILDPLAIFRIFQNISHVDLELLDFDTIEAHPENLVICYLPIPPLAVRPSVFIGDKMSNEDDLTIKLTEIHYLNNRLKLTFYEKDSFVMFKETWNILQIECGRYLNADIFNLEPGNQKFKSLFTRLKGKNGRFRGNLSGKRVDFSGRTIISPDPNLPLNFLGLPIRLAKRLTFPEKVNYLNIERLKRTVSRGTTRFPGANFIVDFKNNKQNINLLTKDMNCFEVKIGYKVERHLKTNDVVFFNRQPSLHRISIMAHRVKIMPGKTFRINECVCKPYNADFDGDEMNIHVPQTQKAKAECICLLNLVLNINSPGTGESMITATQDFLSASFILTSKDRFYSRNQMGEIIQICEIEKSETNILVPAILKPYPIWTGKQIYSMIIFSTNKESFSENRRIRNNDLVTENIFQLIEKNYSFTSSQCSPFLCPYDGWILCKNGNLLAGQIGKLAIGSGNTISLFNSETIFDSFHSIMKCLLRISRLTSSWFSNVGFSFGLKEVLITKKLFAKKRNLVLNCHNICNSIQLFFAKFRLYFFKFAKICESQLQKIFAFLREDFGVASLRLHEFTENSGIVMAASGSKGSANNLSQMIFCLGQQTVSGERIQRGFFRRIVPHFKPLTSTTIQMKFNGFIEKSFLQGLDAIDFFFHAIAGREGLIDTAVKTSETGYLQRRIMKTLEDIIIFYDSSSRTSDGRLIQPHSGIDCVNPGKISFLYNLPACARNETKKLLSRNSVLNFWETESFLRSISFVNMDTIPFQLKLRDYFFSSRTLFDFKSENDIRNIEHTLLSTIENFNKFKMEPGSSVGALAAQSIGEPGTQMTLQTFHHAGVSEFNITQGVPRINEIMNASKKILSSIVSFTFSSFGKKENFYKYKSRIEKIYLAQIVNRLDIILNNEFLYIDLYLKKKHLGQLCRGINLKNIVEKLRQTNFIWNKSKFFLKKCQNLIRIFPNKSSEKTDFNFIDITKIIYSCKKDFSRVVVCGLVEPQYVTAYRSEKKNFILMKNAILNDVFGLSIVDINSLTCNHVLNVLETFGIEASMKSIITEIQHTFHVHDISINSRHLFLLAEVMCFTGKILGLTRYGLAKMRENTLVLASFEKTIENLFSASLKTSNDKILGVSENIILGRKPANGTGIVSLVWT